MIRSHLLRMGKVALLWLLFQGITGADQTSVVRVAVKSEARCETNLLQLSDVADLSGSELLVQRLKSISLGPSPAEGKTLKIDRSEILQLLQLRGFSSDALRWTGAEVCKVSRSHETPIDKSKFVSTTANPMNAIVAEKNLEQVLLTYLQQELGNTLHWKVKPLVPKEYTKLLTLRRNILGIAGGQPPYEGKQTFELLVQTNSGEQTLFIEAMIEPPDMVVATVEAMREGQVIVEKDIKIQPLTSRDRLKIEDCFIDPRKLIGMELKKSVSSGQVLSKKDVGAPRVIEVNDVVYVEVISGSVSVQTTAKALEAGGMGELISVEVLPQKKRLFGQVMGPRKVQIANPNGS